MDVSLVDEQLVLHSFPRTDLVILTLDLIPLKQLLLSLYTQCTYMYVQDLHKKPCSCMTMAHGTVQ